MDSLVLYSPAGSSFQLGSYIMYDPGPDFGEAGLMVPRFAINPAAEGGVRSHREIGIRRFTIPMRVGSSAAYTDQQAISLMRLYADKGAYIDVQPEGTPSGESVRFDVEDGRFELSYNPFLNRIDRNDGNLLLDVQPYGYWPTMILLASAASVGGPGVLSLSLGGSIFGDAPGLAEIFVAPTSATSYGPNQRTESLYWSFGARPSFQAFWPAGSMVWPTSFIAAFGATLVGDLFAPGSQAIRHLPSSNTAFTNPLNLAVAQIPGSLEPAYRGRFRLYVFARFGPSQNIPYNMIGDTGVGSFQFTTFGGVGALGSAAPIATLPVSVSSWTAPGGQGPSPAYSFLDLGEIGLPAIASNPNDLQIRIWGMPASQFTTMVASTTIDIGGVYLQPLDGAAGVLPRGLNQPTVNACTSFVLQGQLYQNAVTRDNFVALPTSSVASLTPMINGLSYYRGGQPVVGASTIQLDLMLAGKRIEDGTPAAQPAIRSQPPYAQVSVRYRPRFAFLKGI